jgi:hypothetical protein
MIARGVALFLIFVLPGAADAASAPEGLRGKSVVVTWRENRVQRRVGDEQFRSTSVQHQFQVQVGSDGRVSARMTNTNERGRSGSRSDGGGWRYDFGPQSMTILMGGGGGGGARRIVVRFEKGFASCTGYVIRGKETGARSMMTTSMISGRRMEIQSAIAVGVSCRVQAGSGE